MALKPREVDQAEGRGYVSTITAEDLAAYADGYADGIDSDEYEEENHYAEIEKKKTFGDKLTAAKVAIQNFSLPSPDEIKVLKSFAAKICLFSHCDLYILAKNSCYNLGTFLLFFIYHID